MALSAFYSALLQKEPVDVYGEAKKLNITVKISQFVERNFGYL